MKPKVDQPQNPLFTNGENFHMNACVGDNGGPYELFDYGRGFFAGGHAIVKAAKENVAPVDILVYPAAFAYRHAVELLLKQLTKTLNRVLEARDGFQKHHNMIDLWNEVQSLNQKTRLELADEKDVARAGELIGYFDAFDPTGQVFRYPEGIRGNRHLADHKLINVEVLQEQMQELQSILECWYYAASDYLDWMREEAAIYDADR
jgi:hypothetical protein